MIPIKIKTEESRALGMKKTQCTN